MTLPLTSETAGQVAELMPTSSNVEVLTGVSGHFSAAHRDFATGEMHGHTWLVTAWFKPPYRSDARRHKTDLDRLLATWDHTTMPDDLARGEDIARAVATLDNVVEVEIRRPTEGFHARWRKA